MNPGRERHQVPLGAALSLPGFLVASLASLVLGGGGALLLETAVHSKDAVIQEAFIRDGKIVDVITANAEVSSAHRGFLLTGEASYLGDFERSHDSFVRRLAELELSAEGDEARLLGEIAREDATRVAAARDSMHQRSEGATAQELRAILLATGQPVHDALVDKLSELRAHARARVREMQAAAKRTARRALWALGASTGIALIAAVATALALSRSRRLLRSAWRDLEEKVTEVQHANQDLDAFAGRVAHDLSNALMPLNLAPGMIRGSLHRPENLERIAVRMEGLGRNAKRLLEGLLAFSRGGTLEPGAASDLEAELAAVLEELSPLADRVEARIQSSTVPVWVCCSPALLHIVLLNLLSNALKFLEGCPVREVNVRWERSSTQVRICVQDTGPGIPAAEQSRIFQPFYRVPGARAPGTGLGLATVKRILEAHRGSIEVSAANTGGTLFTLLLPAVPEPVDGREVVPSCEQSAPSS